MSELPPCIHRGPVTADTCVCHSPQLVSTGPVSLDVCHGKPWNLPACRYATPSHSDRPTTARPDRGVQKSPVSPKKSTRRSRPLSRSGNARTPRKPPLGPGTALHNLLADLGLSIDESAGCGCKSMQAKMDRWGPAGCETHRDEILDHLRTQIAALTWRDKLRVAWRILRTRRFGLLFSRNRPAWLLNCAIRTSRESADDR